MKKGLLKSIFKIAALGLVTTGLASAASVADNVRTIFTESSFIIRSGAVIAALYGGYKVLLESTGSGVHWFMLIIGGAMAGAYTQITGVIVSFFENTKA